LKAKRGRHWTTRKSHIDCMSKNKIIGILQPGYLPWLGFFEQMARVDLFVIYDDVQYEKGAWRNRNRIKTAQGVQWLTVPVRLSGEGFPLIREVGIDSRTSWRTKHVRTLCQNYAKARYFPDHGPDLCALLEQDWDLLLDLNMVLIRWLAERLGISTELVLSSDLGIPGTGAERLIKIIRHLGCEVFYEGAAGRNYIRPETFREQGIDVVFQDYVHPVYPQLYGDFISHLSVVDLLFNRGPESLSIILAGNPERSV
jgi:hypothetical protein